MYVYFALQNTIRIGTWAIIVLLGKGWLYRILLVIQGYGLVVNEVFENPRLVEKVTWWKVSCDISWDAQKLVEGLTDVWFAVENEKG